MVVPVVDIVVVAVSILAFDLVLSFLASFLVFFNRFLSVCLVFQMLGSGNSINQSVVPHPAFSWKFKMWSNLGGRK